MNALVLKPRGIDCRFAHVPYYSMRNIYNARY